MRSTLAVIGGFVLWSVLWLVYNAVLRQLGVLPADTTQPVQSANGLLLLLAGSIVMSLAAGYTTARLARSVSATPIALLGVLLVAVGVAVELQYWRLVPIWYHLSFLVLLIPMCFVGASVRFRGADASSP